MFTGLVEEKGTVREIQRTRDACVLTIGCKKVLPGTNVGDSIMVNGVCLTVTSLREDGFTADMMAETLSRSSFGSLSPGAYVNLERAMPVNGRFGGHIVSGHSDGTGTIRSVRRDGNAVWYTVDAAPELLRYIVKKGSIAMDGISLTVADVEESGFSVSVIPHTLSETTLSDRREGDSVNLECDIIGKYVEKLTAHPGGTMRERSSDGPLTEDFLRECGF